MAARVSGLVCRYAMTATGTTLGRSKPLEVVAGCFTAEQKQPYVRPPVPVGGSCRTCVTSRNCGQVTCQKAFWRNFCERRRPCGHGCCILGKPVAKVSGNDPEIPKR